MKTSQIHKQAKAAQSSKLHKLGAQGSLSMARKGQSAAIADAKKYATGGYVGGGTVSGGSAKPSTSRPGKAKKAGSKPKAKGKGDTNIIIMAGGKPPGGDLPPPDVGPMPLPPGGPGGGGPPMRAKGGRITPQEEPGKGADLSKDKQLAKPFRKGGKC